MPALQSIFAWLQANQNSIAWVCTSVLAPLVVWIKTLHGAEKKRRIRAECENTELHTTIHRASVKGPYPHPHKDQHKHGGR